ERDRRRDLEHEVELQRSGDLGVESAARVIDLDLFEPLPQTAEVTRQSRQTLFGSKDACARVHLELHLLADRADSLHAALLLELLGLDTTRLFSEHHVDWFRGLLFVGVL